MGMLSVQVPQAQQNNKPSALENAAKVLGIVTSLGNLGAGISGAITGAENASANQLAAKTAADKLAFLKEQNNSADLPNYGQVP